MIDWARWKPLSADWPLLPPFPATSDLFFCFDAGEPKYPSQLWGGNFFWWHQPQWLLRPGKRRKKKKEEDFCCLTALVTLPAATLARSLKATPTGNCINPKLRCSNSLPSSLKALPEFYRTTSAVLSEENRSRRPQGLPSMCSLIGLMTAIIYWGACCAGYD